MTQQEDLQGEEKKKEKKSELQMDREMPQMPHSLPPSLIFCELGEIKHYAAGRRRLSITHKQLLCGSEMCGAG